MCKNNILLGIDTARPLRQQTVQDVIHLHEQGVLPRLTIVRVGENPGDMAYERAAKKRMEASKIICDCIDLPCDVTQEELNACLDRLSEDVSVHAILLMRPLQNHLCEIEARDHVDPKKDVDGMCSENIAGVFESGPDVFHPCTAEACIRILEHNKIQLDGANVVVVGRSRVIGRPVAMMCMDRGATPTICHTHTKNLAEICRSADILIVACGVAKMIGEDMVSENTCVIDVGINVDSEGSLCGDVDFEAVAPKVAAITPVPRGVGSVTTSVLAQHVVQAARLRVIH